MPTGETKEKRPFRADPPRTAREKTPGACGERLRGEFEGGAKGDRRRQENAKALSEEGDTEGRNRTAPNERRSARPRTRPATSGRNRDRPDAARSRAQRSGGRTGRARAERARTEAATRSEERSGLPTRAARASVEAAAGRSVRSGEVGEGRAVHVAPDHLVEARPKPHGGARGLPRTRRFRLKRAARHRRGRALHGAQDVANPHGGRIARKRVAASLPAHAGQKPRPHERTGKLLEIFEGDALALRHFAQRHLVLWPGLRKTHHEPERIAPLRRHEHCRPSLLAQTVDPNRKASRNPLPTDVSHETFVPISHDNAINSTRNALSKPRVENEPVRTPPIEARERVAHRSA